MKRQEFRVLGLCFHLDHCLRGEDTFEGPFETVRKKHKERKKRAKMEKRGR